MYRTGQAQDLIDFAQSEMKAMCTQYGEEVLSAVENCNRFIRSQNQVKPPTESPKNSHFYTPKPGSAEEKQKKEEGEEEEEEEAGPPKEPARLGEYVKPHAKSQRADKNARKAAASHDDQHQKAKDEREQRKKRTFAIWKKANHGLDMGNYTAMTKNMWRDRYETLTEQLVTKEIGLEDYQVELQNAFFMPYCDDGTLVQKYKDIMPLVQNLAYHTYAYMGFETKQIVEMIANLIEGIEMDVERFRGRQEARIPILTGTLGAGKQSPALSEPVDFQEVFQKDKGNGRTLRIDESVNKKNDNFFSALGGLKTSDNSEWGAHSDSETEDESPRKPSRGKFASPVPSKKLPVSPVLSPKRADSPDSPISLTSSHILASLKRKQIAKVEQAAATEEPEKKKPRAEQTSATKEAEKKDEAEVEQTAADAATTKATKKDAPKAEEPTDTKEPTAGANTASNKEGGEGSEKAVHT
ncbi:hypothetical protein PG985_009992 [Apiospora marii]|uniref:Uncharacterized protein n=1 Tax=Apiospora marii TaxID=335849 RepID=A0ABR1RKQ6_9PEZI